MEISGLSQEIIDQPEKELQAILDLKFMEWYLLQEELFEDKEIFPFSCYASKAVNGIQIMVNDDASFEILFFHMIRDFDEVFNHILSLPGSEEFLFHMDIIQKRTRILDGNYDW